MRFVLRPVTILRTLPGDTDDIIVHETTYSAGQQPRSGPLYRMDTRTGRKTEISGGKPDSALSEGWIVDRNGVPRGYEASDAESTRIYYRASAEAPWQKLDEFKRLAGNTWSLAALSPDENVLWASSRKGRDTAAIIRYDVASKAFGEVVAEHPRVDLSDLRGDKQAIRGVHYEADRGGTAWFDESLAKTQAMVDKALADTVNTLSWSEDRQHVLVTAYSDLRPSSYYLLDVKAGKLEWLADSRPWIDPKAMSPMTPVRYAARDGLEIPAYLTIPRGSSGKKLPLVVNVHGGPWVAGDTWRWNPEVQFLASRGYAVLQPNFRGTTRYGWKHYSSSFKQWGLAMQDDITDGVKWAIDQGIADPERICIYGASYGGYAAMMGVAKTPEVFKCAINYVGVTDLPLLMTASWSDSFNSDFVRFSNRHQIGDVDSDLDRLKATSPDQLADRIKAPVLMAYGGSDVRVVPQHGTRMRDALEKAGRPPEWMLVDEEGHGYRKLENQVMFYGAMEKFLDKNIGAR
jgi:dipeptidyl aminopeptidase/acylaminoacyl peptidase